MIASRLAPFVRVRLAAAALAVLCAAGCGQQAPEDLSATLLLPTSPGDGYGLVKTADSLHDIRNVRVAGNSLFFEIPWQGLYAMPKYGGDITAVDRDPAADFFGLATTGDTVLWLKAHAGANDVVDDFILRRPVEGGATTPLRRGDLGTIGFNNLPVLVSDSSHVYFVTDAFIDVTPIAGGAAESLPLPASPAGRGFVTVAGDYPTVYFTTCAGVTTGCVLERGDVPSGTSQVITSVPDDTEIVGMDQDAVYLLDGARLWSISRGDGAETALIGPEAGVHPIGPAALDAQRVYFMGTEPGAAALPAERLMAVPKAGGPPEVVGADPRIRQYIPWDLAVDDQFVFVLTSPMTVSDGNEILAFPKTSSTSP